MYKVISTKWIHPTNWSENVDCGFLSHRLAFESQGAKLASTGDIEPDSTGEVELEGVIPKRVSELLTASLEDKPVPVKDLTFEECVLFFEQLGFLQIAQKADAETPNIVISAVSKHLSNLKPDLTLFGLSDIQSSDQLVLCYNEIRYSGMDSANKFRIVAALLTEPQVQAHLTQALLQNVLQEILSSELSDWEKSTFVDNIFTAGKQLSTPTLIEEQSLTIRSSRLSDTDKASFVCRLYRVGYHCLTPALIQAERDDIRKSTLSETEKACCVYALYKAVRDSLTPDLLQAECADIRKSTLSETKKADFVKELHYVGWKHLTTALIREEREYIRNSPLRNSEKARYICFLYDAGQSYLTQDLMQQEQDLFADPDVDSDKKEWLHKLFQGVKDPLIQEEQETIRASGLSDSDKAKAIVTLFSANKSRLTQALIQQEWEQIRASSEMSDSEKSRAVISLFSTGQASMHPRLFTLEMQDIEYSGMSASSKTRALNALSEIMDSIAGAQEM